MKYIIIDLANVFYRGRFAVQGSVDMKLGMAFHLAFTSIRKAWKDFNGDHIIIALEGRSWRKDYYQPYKRNRTEARAAHTEEEAAEEKVFWEAYEEFQLFLRNKTNCTVLQHPRLEADDLIAGWVQSHPNSDHVIISTDTDFQQLIAPNVTLYNGISEVTTTLEGYFDAKGKVVTETKTGLPKVAPIPEWILFQKCIRGDTSDNVFSAYPRVRTVGTKNKIGLTEAYADKDSQGFNWNNLMLQTWTDHNAVKHRVLDDYTRNCVLIDLTKQPQDIREIITNTVNEACAVKKDVAQVGINLLKLCALYDLRRISDQVGDYAIPLNAKYSE